MLTLAQKIKILRKFLESISNNYIDSFKADLLIYFDEFNETNFKFKFLEKLNNEEDIHNYTNNLISKIIMKYNEEEEQLSDFIFYELCDSLMIIKDEKGKYRIDKAKLNSYEYFINQ